MSDEIVLRGVTAHGYHGVLEAEKRDGQTFVVDVHLTLDLSRAGRSDNLAATVNYAEVASAVVARVTGPAFDLIERLAEVIADDVLAFPLVDAVEVVVHKPEAPVGHPFTDVEVRIRRSSGPRAVIALGSNLGDRGRTLSLAVDALRALPGFTVTAVSPMVETDPVGGPDQPPYLNAVVVGRTTLDPTELLEALHRIESAHGRTREVRWGPRTLDLDLIQFGTPGSADEVVSADDSLTLPHPRAAERAFVIVPWATAEPDGHLRPAPEDPRIRPLRELLDGLDTSGIRPGPEWGTW
ncbi:2-amino-4-hydroxy-6-hydroxymethyldihydropteridine diphosphokinase [Intrasporangium sp. DVR]|uniref:2-amino-4-hydroxy-6- hydroxymethyldihydropteridine diphosphokinase n=1 Tax=Intrasporangium sp. DVR TaxID=3127867 RepID=UPI00313A55C8